MDSKIDLGVSKTSLGQFKATNIKTKKQKTLKPGSMFIIWTLENIKKIYDAIEQNNEPIQLTSKRYFFSDFPKVAIELCVEMNNNVNYFAIWLRQMGPNSSNNSVNTKYYIYADKDGKTVDIARSTYLRSTYNYENQEKLGYSLVLMEKVLRSNGHLYLYCEVRTSYYISNENLQNKYYEMIEKGTFTDCIIKIGDEIIKAHRIILALNSEVFYKMFEQNGLNESQTGELIITDTTSECFRAMLQFFYTKKIDKEILENNVFDIFAISHKYQVMPLKYECERLMSSKIDTENIVKYCSIINLYDDTSTLEEACKSFFRINIKNLLNSNEWKEIKNNYPKLAIQFLESNIDDTHNK